MKLKTRELEKLRALCPKGKFPKSPSEDVDAAFDTEAELQALLEAERSKKGLRKLSITRRAFYGISTLNSYYKGDGLTTGVAINDPELILAAIDGAKAMSLVGAAKILMRAKRWFPPETT